MSVWTYIWIANAWNWHSDDCWPAAIPSSAINVPIFPPRLLHDAKKIKRLIGLSKPRPSRNVVKMKKILRSEMMEVTLSVIPMALICPGVTLTAMTATVRFNRWTVLWHQYKCSTGKMTASKEKKTMVKKWELAKERDDLIIGGFGPNPNATLLLEILHIRSLAGGKRSRWT